jgi:SAM-dependent methyltransferase
MSTNEKLYEHYNKKYAEQHSQVLKKIVVKERVQNRNEGAVFWARGGQRVLEVGCGSGDVLYTLEDKYRYLIGVELSRPRFEHLTRAFGNNDNVKIIHANIEHDELDIAAGSVDTIVMTDVIEHLVEPISVLKKLYGYLMEGGELIIATPNIAKWSRRIKLLFGFFPGTASLDEGLLMYDGKTPTDIHDEGHLHYFTNRSLTKILKERFGFSEVEIKGYGLKYLSSLLPNLFSDCFVIARK